MLFRISNQQLMQQKHYENKLNENSLLSDLHGWRDVISNTLNVIEKVSIQKIRVDFFSTNYVEL